MEKPRDAMTLPRGDGGRSVWPHPEKNDLFLASGSLLRRRGGWGTGTGTGTGGGGDGSGRGAMARGGNGGVVGRSARSRWREDGRERADCVGAVSRRRMEAPVLARRELRREDSCAPSVW